ncbi:CBS domain-containing protein [Natronococcus wangiae]|uniref:CBS domain-containing protein n=1 Tax=Natronococcus wangiae TaxID=3068275 RepID=UPI00273D1718|nr:CBS domain-containing protein [Natronococcus sp. AD5]
MSTVETAQPDDTANEVARRFVGSGLESIVIVDDEPSGIVTRSDFVSLIASDEPVTQTTREFMSEPLISIELLTSVHEAAGVLHEHQINQLPVLDTEKLVGLVTATDFSHFVTLADSSVPYPSCRQQYSQSFSAPVAFPMDTDPVEIRAQHGSAGDHDPVFELALAVWPSIPVTLRHRFRPTGLRTICVPI